MMRYKTRLAMCAMAHYAIIVQDAPYGLLWRIMLWYEACLTACYGTMCYGMRHALTCVIAHYAVV